MERKVVSMEAGNDKFEIPENSEIEDCIIKVSFPTSLPLLDQSYSVIHEYPLENATMHVNIL